MITEMYSLIMKLLVLLATTQNLINDKILIYSFSLTHPAFYL